MRWENCLKHPKSSFVIYLVVFLDTQIVGYCQTSPKTPQLTWRGEPFGVREGRCRRRQVKTEGVH